jgi:hypothetical protein
MTLETLNSCFSGNTESVKNARNRQILVLLDGEHFPQLKVTDFTITTAGDIVLITKRT